MLLAIAWLRRLASDKADATWSTTVMFMLGMVGGGWSLHDEFGMKCAGRLQCLEDGDDVSRAGAQPRQRLHQVGDGAARLRDQGGAVLLLQVDARVRVRLGADRSARVAHQDRLRDGV